MKRLVFIVLSVLIIVSFAGCGADSSSAPEDDSNSGNPESVVAVEDGETGDCESGDDVTQDVEEVESPGEPDEQPVAMEDSPQGGAQPPADGTVAPEDMGDRPTDEERPIAEDGSEMPRGVQDRPQGGGREQQMIDMASVAEELGVTEEALIEALGDPSQGPPDFAVVAETLGITEEDLMEAMGMQ